MRVRAKADQHDAGVYLQVRGADPGRMALRDDFGGEMTNREIDALVAEKAMGWKWVPRSDGIGFLLPPDWRQMEGWIHTPTCVETNLIRGIFGEGEISHKHQGTVRPYSSNPAASKQLRDRMRELGWQWALRTGTQGDFHCEFYKLPVKMDTYFDALSGTEEMATALAVLSALHQP